MGRTNELAELVAAMTRAAEGTPGLVVVGGEAGVGKSRLLSELAARGVNDGLRVLLGQCVELDEATIPLLPVADALRGLAEDGAPDLPSAASGPRRRHARRGASVRLHLVVLDRLAEAAATAPIVLMIEDVHWADRSTLELLGSSRAGCATSASSSSRPTATTRSTGASACGRFLADVATAPRGAAARSRSPDARGHGRAARRDPRRAAAAGAPRRRLRALGGQPVLRRGAAAAAPGGRRGAAADAARHAAGPHPRARPARQAVVRIAAAGGRDVHHQLLAAAAGLPEPDLSDTLRDAVRQHVLVAVGDGYAFRHALFSEAAYGELLPGERARVHAAFAAALEARPDLAGGNTATVTAEIAHHWLRAGDDPRALAAAVRAGTEAERVGALAEAAEHDQRALALWDRVADAERLAGIDRAALLARAADAAAWTGDAAGAIELVDAAIALRETAAEPERVAALLQQRARFLWQLGRAPESVLGLERAVALLPADPPTVERAEALGALGLMVMLSGQYARSRTYAEQALAVARAVGARAEEAVALNCLGIDLDALGDRAAGLEHLRRGWAIATDVGRADVLSQAALLLSDSLRSDGQLERSTEIALEGAEVARRAGLEMFERMCKCNAAQAAFELGRWDLVDRISREMLVRDFSG